MKKSGRLSSENFSDELLAKQMIPLMVRAFIITRGANGATLYQEEHKQLLETEIASEANQNPISTIGSGDIFGVSFLYAYLKKKNYFEAASFAEKSSAHSTKFSCQKNMHN